MTNKDVIAQPWHQYQTMPNIPWNAISVNAGKSLCSTATWSTWTTLNDPTSIKAQYNCCNTADARSNCFLVYQTYFDFTHVVVHWRTLDDLPESWKFLLEFIWEHCTAFKRHFKSTYTQLIWIKYDISVPGPQIPAMHDSHSPNISSEWWLRILHNYLIIQNCFSNVYFNLYFDAHLAVPQHTRLHCIFLFWD